MIVKRERTRQQLDPAGVSGMRPVTIAAAVAAFLYALLMTLVVEEPAGHPLLAALSLTLLGAACSIVIVQSSALRAPLSATTHLLVQFFALGAATLSVAAYWGVNRFIHDDWAPVSIGILLLALSSYRPSRELAGAGVLMAIYLGFLAMLEAPMLAARAPSVAFVVAAVTPMLALCFAAAMFSSSFISSLEHWHRRAESATKKLAKQMQAGIARSVQQDRVTILNKEVLPFFADVLARGDITVTDRDRAASIADSIRRLMVAESDRSWLEQVVEQALHGRGEGVSGFVNDPQRLAPMITTDQRTALRAFLVALFDEPTFDRQSLRFEFERARGGCLGTLTAHVDGSDFAMRSALAPYLAVMRVVFCELHVELNQSKLEIRMSYEQQR
ncbi:hypothetical protein [Parafrigoribacterium soli]|uniref:hypothetical protein n=1 Tax=Parafrigoribacterium soli TaxID=3144663 RepID=UPI0032EDB0CF